MTRSPFNWSESALARLAEDLKDDAGFTVKLSPAVEGLALTAWWRTHYGTPAARARTRRAAMAGHFAGDEARSALAPGPALDINEDARVASRDAPVNVELNAVVIQLRKELAAAREAINWYAVQHERYRMAHVELGAIVAKL